MRKRLGIIVAAVILFSAGLVTGQVWSKNEVENDHLIAATLWYQRAAEVKALSYQAFNAARSRLNQALEKEYERPTAIVVDIDETILDNSPYHAWSVLENKSYPSGWRDWIEQGNAEPIAGAKEFINFAISQGVEVFMVSNRKKIGLDPTYENLQAQGFNIKKENIYLRDDKNRISKIQRMKGVMKSHEVLLFIGDSMADFDRRFESTNLKKRLALTHKLHKEFGNKFIVLPNPLYGEWENILYNDMDANITEDDAARLQYLKPMLPSEEQG